MNYLKHCAAVAAVLCMCASANAGLFGGKWGGGGCGASKCDSTCAAPCAPTSCKPVVVRPCQPNVYQYQRKCSTIKPPCCDGCCPSAGCAPSGCCDNACDPAGACAAPAACCPADACAAPAACCPADCCAAPCGNGCVDGACGCAAPCDTGKGCGLFGGKKGGCFADNGCAAPAGCAAPCADDCCPTNCCPEIDPCKLAELIYTSMTACYAKDRRKAIHKLGGKYDCVCNPEIMSAFIYALNDADEDVRKEAADEIGDQLRKNPCCCCPKVTAALTCALGDCDRGVRRQAEQALRTCGYDIVDGCCDGCDSNLACTSNGCAPVQSTMGVPMESSQPTTAPAVNPEAKPAPTPAPPAEPKAYFPRRLPNTTTARPVQQRRGLSNLFGLVD